jgi:lactate permease
MMLALQAAPLLVLLLALGSGRPRGPMGPLLACGMALLAALPAMALMVEGPLPGFLWRESLRAGWLALQPIAVMSGGLLFHAAVQGNAEAEARPATAARVFAATLPLGAFLESVTGFAVGAVFALVALRRMGVRGAVAVALSMQALVLVPWGGLGPGSAWGRRWWAAGAAPAGAGGLAERRLGPGARPGAVVADAAGRDPCPGARGLAQLGLLAIIAVGLVARHRRAALRGGGRGGDRTRRRVGAVAGRSARALAGGGGGELAYCC